MRPMRPKSCTTIARGMCTRRSARVNGEPIWKGSAWEKTCGSAPKSIPPGSSRCTGKGQFSWTTERLPVLKIGSLLLSNPLVLAPLAGISDLPFRLLAKEQGCGLVHTEMISAEGLVRNRKAVGGLMKSCPEERPLGVQIFGSSPESMAAAAKIAEECGA